MTIAAEEPTRWRPTLACAVAAVAAAAYLWFGWCVFPLTEWNEVRLAPAFALRHGYGLYAPLGGGPLSTWIYGPLTPLLHVPATLAPSPATALQISGAINLLTLIVPLLLIGGSVGLQGRSRLTALAVSILLLPPTAVTFQVADHAAIACGLISCWCLARQASPGRSALIAAAAWSILSILAKQTSIFLVVGHVAYLGLYCSRGDAVRYAAWTAALGAGVTLCYFLLFGIAPLWLNLVQIPARLPWGDPVEKLGFRWPSLVAYLVAPLAILGLLRRRRAIPERSTVTGRLLRCGGVAFFAALPIGLFAFFKIGGDFNVFHSWFYLLPVLVAALAAGVDRRPEHARWLLVAVTFVVALRTPEWRAMPLEPLTKNVAEATRLAQVAPGTAWFPYNPVVTFYSDRRLYHVEDGLATRHLAGFGVREADFRRHLPARLKTVIYPKTYAAPFALGLLPDFKLTSRAGQWAIYQAPPTTGP